MRLADYLSLVLQTQGQTLARLTAFFGEERFLELLEKDEIPTAPFPEVVLSSRLWTTPAGGASESSAYAELESSVSELSIPAFLVFHVWAYPWYRHFIESGLPLTSRFNLESKESEQNVELLLRETLHAQEAWFRSLNLPPVLAPAAEKAAGNPWLRFRAELMRKLGRKPLSLA